DHATVAVDDGGTSWIVRFDPVVDGTPIENLSSTVTVGGGGAIEYANGFLATPTKVDSYPLVTTNVAIDRLNKGIGLPGPVPLVGQAGDVGSGDVAIGDAASIGADDPAVTGDTPITTGTIAPNSVFPVEPGSTAGGAPGSTGGSETPAAPPVAEPPI